MVTDLSIDSVFRKSLKEFFRYAPFYIITSLGVSLVCTLLVYLLIHFLPEEYLQFLSIPTEKYPLLFSRLPYPLLVFMVAIVTAVILLAPLGSYLIWMYHAFTIKRTQNPPRAVFVDLFKSGVFFKGLTTFLLYIGLISASSAAVILPVISLLFKFNMLYTAVAPIFIILSFLPSVFLSIRLFAATFIAFEGKYYGIAALRESFKRTDGYFYQIMVLTVLTGLICGIIAGVLYFFSILFIAILAKITGTREQYTVIEVFLRFRLFLMSQKSWLILVGSWLMWAVRVITPAFGVLVLAEIYSRISIPDVAIIHKDHQDQ